MTRLSSNSNKRSQTYEICGKNTANFKKIAVFLPQNFIYEEKATANSRTIIVMTSVSIRTRRGGISPITFLTSQLNMTFHNILSFLHKKIHYQELMKPQIPHTNGDEFLWIYHLHFWK